MRLQSLKRLVSVARTLGDSDRIIVFGSSSLLASFPDLGERGGPIEASLDADLLVEPCDEQLATIFDEAIGQGRSFEKRFGYHADILRPVITGVLPHGWDQRLVPLADCEGVFCLDPHDLAVAKLRAGRPKDIALLATLLQRYLLDEKTIRERIAQTHLSEMEIIATNERLNEAIGTIE